jgi:nicotinamidase-related amidase
MKKDLLLIIDLQNGWRHRTATEKVMQKTVKLAQQFNGDVVHCCFKNDPKSLFYKQLNWSRFIEPRDTDQIPEIAELQLPVYWRSTYNCVTDETLPVFKKYNHIYITGVFTDISVHATALCLFDEGIKVSVVKDAICTLHGNDVHNVYLKSLEMALDKKHVITSKELELRTPS